MDTIDCYRSSNRYSVANCVCSLQVPSFTPKTALDKFVQSRFYTSRKYEAWYVITPQACMALQGDALRM